MSLRFVIGVRLAIIALLGVLYLNSGDGFFLTLAAIVGIVGVWTVYRSMRS